MLIEVLLSLMLLPGAPPQERPGADQLVEQAWTLLPAYDGSQRWLLSSAAERETQAGAFLLKAGLALDPKHLRGLWSLGHAHSLLAENLRTRGDLPGASLNSKAAIDALSRAMALDSNDAWSPYARAMAHTSAGAHDLALADLRLALGNAQRALSTGEDQSNMRFKSLEWLPEVLMRAGRHTEAREALRRFHGEFSSNSWPLLIALAESFQRERDFLGARAIYQEIIQDYPNDFQAYALLGYLDGLSGHGESAVQQLLLAIRNERFAGMYTRLWLWILATPELEAKALLDLKAFLKNPPDSLGAWDRILGLFATGQLDFPSFEASSLTEYERRLVAAEPLDGLLSEAAYYRGQRHEREAHECSQPAEQKTKLQAAQTAYRQALEARPLVWKWEWAYARLGFARVSAELGDNSQVDQSIELPSPLRWHRPGTEQPQSTPPKAWQPGDLILEPIQRLIATAIRCRTTIHYCIGKLVPHPGRC